MKQGSRHILSLLLAFFLALVTLYLSAEAMSEGIEPITPAILPPTPTAIPLPTPTPTPTPTPCSGLPGAFAPLDPLIAARMERGRSPRDDFPPLLQGRLLVTLYGTPLGRGLGILGTASATETVRMAEEQAAAYRDLLTDTEVIPGFHMVVVIADAYPGEDGDYNHRVPPALVQQWIDVARAHGLWVVLDVQTGHSPITRELSYVEPFLLEHDVHLAVDPEFMMSETLRIPGERIGFMDGGTLNFVQHWLAGVARRSGERKLLIIHQFDDRMFAGKAAIRDEPLVELVWDADGFGPPAGKIDDYLQYAAEPGFEYGGIKLFYDYDHPLMRPADVLRLRPRPAYVTYQ